MDDTLDSFIYDALRPLLASVLERFRVRGQGASNAAAYLLVRCGPAVRPYLLRFYAERAATGAGMGDASVSASPSCAGIEDQGINAVSVEDRGVGESCVGANAVAELAYLLAEEAGFQGEPAQFWRQAEQLIARKNCHREAS